MCGFAGVIAWDERYRVSQETLAKMSAAIAHRGPDGEAFHINHPEQITPDRPQVALAFRRLAIIDPDPRSMQPFTDGRHWLVFNGEIYNYRELKKELSSLRPDYAWRTTGDTEVLLLSYAVWGEKCVEHLNGMFAFAVWDEVEQSLFLARDRMGQKPLYYSSPILGAMFFASELGAIPKEMLPRSKHPPDAGKTLQPARDWYGDYLAYGCLTLQTPFLMVNSLLPGEFARIKFPPEPTSPYRGFYFKEEATRTKSNLMARLKTRLLVELAVERQLVSDVPIGVFLSGGIDSSVIAAAARLKGPVKTFCIRFQDSRYDESKYARAVADHLGTEHHEFLVEPDAITDLPRLAEVFGEPFGDSSALPTHCLCRATRGFVKVALSGDGGDELFGGYERYRAMAIGSRLKALGILGNLAKPFSRGHPKRRLTRAARFLSSLQQDEISRYDGYLRIFDDATILALAPDALDFPIKDKEFYMQALHFRGDVVEAALACDRACYLPDDLLTKVDRCSMLHGLEVRSPFMDHELVQFAAGLTTDQLLKGGPKRMLREAFADDLPAWVFKRKKMGFAVPIGDWFRGPLRAMLRDTLFSSHAFGRSHFDMKVVERLVEEHETQRVDHSQRLYALLMLELWWNTMKQ
jgi:asparagine synthase (glutamine-hydrolysing)